MPLAQIARTRIAKMLLGKYAKAGWLPTRAIDRCTALGYTFRTQEMFRSFNRFKTAVNRAKAIAAFPKTKRPTKGLMMPEHLRRARKYRLIGEQYFWDESEERYLKKGISWYSNRSTDIEGWIDEYLGKKHPKLYPGQPVPLSIEVTEIQHNIGFPY